MDTQCPHCGFRSHDEMPRFCSACGARMDGSQPAWYEVPGTPGQEPKNRKIAGLCSSVLPGLGQVYNGEVVKGYVLFLLTLAGLVIFIIPGLVVWLYAMYDAYAVAGKMNAGTVEYRPTRTLHLVLFIIVAAIIVVVVILIVIALVVSSLLGQLGPVVSANGDILRNNPFRLP